MDPANGEILAWASVPGYDANNYAEIAANHSELLQDPIVSQVYEPGSVMKMFTAAAAIDAGVVTPDTKVHDVYALHFGGDTIHDSDHRAMGWMSFRDAIAYSRNVVAAEVARRLDTTVDKAGAKLYKTWQRFGIGSPTGVDLTGEVPGIASDPKVTKWQPVDLANRSFGQSVAVTPIQLGTGYTAMINGGFRVQPHLLAAIGGAGQAATAPQRIISASLAGQLQGILHHVTASVPWYAAGLPDPRLRGWRQDRHGPGLGRAEDEVQLQHLQLHVRRLRGRRDAERGDRHAHRRGEPEGHQAGRPGARDHVLPALPAHRERHDPHARASRASAIRRPACPSPAAPPSSSSTPTSTRPGSRASARNTEGRRAAEAPTGMVRTPARPPDGRPVRARMAHDRE